MPLRRVARKGNAISGVGNHSGVERLSNTATASCGKASGSGGREIPATRHSKALPSNPYRVATPGRSTTEQKEEALQTGPLEEPPFSPCERLFPLVAARASDASALIIAGTGSVAVRSGCDIVEVSGVCGFRVELGIEEVVLIGFVVAASRSGLP